MLKGQYDVFRSLNQPECLSSFRSVEASGPKMLLSLRISGRAQPRSFAVSTTTAQAQHCSRSHISCGVKQEQMAACLTGIAECEDEQLTPADCANDQYPATACDASGPFTDPRSVALEAATRRLMWQPPSWPATMPRTYCPGTCGCSTERRLPVRGWLLIGSRCLRFTGRCL